MTGTLQKYGACLRLNLHMLRHALRGRWLGASHVADSYDRLAADYDQNWLRHLKPVTDRLLEQVLTSYPASFPLSESEEFRIFDLGCGTGYTTRILAEHFPKGKVLGVDISEGMLVVARKQGDTANLDYRTDDLLAFLHRQPDRSADLIVSAWAIGYSNPRRVIEEVSRVLKPGGVFTFVVNRMDTLGPVFTAFRNCLAAFPEQTRMALWPRFPKSLESLKPLLARQHLAVAWCEEDAVSLPTLPEGEPVLPWLLKTGVLAGFDAVLPLMDNARVAACFQEAFRRCREPLKHHYMAVIVRKEETPSQA